MTPFGEKLRELRKQHDMTMASMAQYLGVSSAYLSQVEHGRRGTPGMIMIDQICALFGLIWEDAEALKELASLSSPKVVIDTTGLSQDAMIAANLFAQILPKVSEEEARTMAEWLKTRQDKL
ncbi:MAG: helix-turn-helix transcriptional regulator [Alphaproteobacteria bacterium]|nr:helix-turn-helix transcriptional regulator [Alphaproteobacteria bacterium]